MKKKSGVPRLPPELWDGHIWTVSCILLQSAISRAKVYKLKKDSEFYEGCKSNMSFSVAHWTQYLPGVREVTYSNPVKDWRFFCLLTNGQKAVMLMLLLLVHKSTSPFLLSLYHKELTLNLQSRRYQELPGSIPAIALFFANELFRLFFFFLLIIFRR